MQGSRPPHQADFLNRVQRMERPASISRLKSQLISRAPLSSMSFFSKTSNNVIEPILDIGMKADELLSERFFAVMPRM